MHKDAVISPCGHYRYSLTRRWDDSSEQQCLWVMLNPSTADAENDDPTVRRCISFSERLGCGSLEVVNLFAYRSTNPKALMVGQLEKFDIVGPNNYDHWDRAIMDASTIMVAWGASISMRSRPQAGKFWDLLQIKKRQARCLGTTQSRDPRHPLYVPGHADIVQWRRQ